MTMPWGQGFRQALTLNSAADVVSAVLPAACSVVTLYLENGAADDLVAFKLDNITTPVVNASTDPVIPGVTVDIPIPPSQSANFKIAVRANAAANGKILHVMPRVFAAYSG